MGVTAALSPHDLIQSYEGRAGLLARCILYGLVEPDVEIDPNVMITLAYTLVDELRTTVEETPTRFADRAEKAIKWAMRPDVPPEIAVLLMMMLMNDRPMMNKLTVETITSDAWVEFKAKFKDIILV